MTIRETLESAINQLLHLATASLDSEVLLSFVLNKPREYLLAHPDEIVSADKVAQFSGLVRQRAQHKPMAYLTKQKDFYGRAFFVDERVHIPRPATEDLIDYIKDLVSPGFDGTIADIGTGSGCIAITLALLYPQAMIIAIDISEDALAVAMENARRHQVVSRIKFVRGDLLTPLTTPVDIIISNPPYGWPEAARRHPSPSATGDEGWTDDNEVFFQPRLSYNGGNDGLNVIKRLLAGIPSRLKTNGQAFLEFDPRQVDALETLLQKTDFSWQIKKDLSGFDRICHLDRHPYCHLEPPVAKAKGGERSRGLTMKSNLAVCAGISPSISLGTTDSPPWFDK